jgi:hypothetical protein
MGVHLNKKNLHHLTMYYIYFKHDTWMYFCQWGAFRTEEARNHIWDRIMKDMTLPKVTMNGQDYYCPHDGYEYSKTKNGG